MTYILKEIFACLPLLLLLGSLLFAVATVGLVAVHRIKANQGFDSQPSCGQGELPSANRTDQPGH